MVLLSFFTFKASKLLRWDEGKYVMSASSIVFNSMAMLPIRRAPGTIQFCSVGHKLKSP